MKNFLVAVLVLLTSFCLSSCHSSGAHTGTDADSARSAAAPVPESVHNPEFREHLKTAAVADYKEEKNDMNNWFFSARLYETPKTMYYRLEMQYEELKGDDTLRLPDLGTPPRPVIRKGKDKYSCIIGFMDNEDQFREYKLVYVKDNEVLATKTLKHYSVTQGYRLVSLDAQ